MVYMKVLYDPGQTNAYLCKTANISSQKGPYCVVYHVLVLLVLLLELPLDHQYEILPLHKHFPRATVVLR